MKDICSGIEKIREVGYCSWTWSRVQTTWDSECCLFTKHNITSPTQQWQGGCRDGKKANARAHCEGWRKRILFFFFFPIELRIVARDCTSWHFQPNWIAFTYLHFLKCSETQRILSCLLMLWLAVSKRISPSSGERSRLSHVIKAIGQVVTPLRSWMHKMCHLWKLK